jgi:electron transfer flavoprotein alpha/beta subunit
VCDTDTPNADLQSKSLSPDGRLLLVGLQVIDIDTGRVTPLAAHAPGPAQVNQVLTTWETDTRVALRISVDGHHRARGQWIVRCTLPTGTCNRERNPVPGN